MRSFKSFLGEKKIAHALDPNKSLKHAIKDRGIDWDNDGDVDALDRKKVLPDEITATEKPDLTATARKKNAAEVKHLKKGVAYEAVWEYATEACWTGYKQVGMKKKDGKEVPNCVPEEVEIEEGSESWEAGYKRRVVKTSKPEHKEKGYNWRIKGKDRPEISIKLYKEKPSQQEFNKQMRRVAGHEFGG